MERDQVNWAALSYELSKFQTQCYAHNIKQGFWEEPISGGNEWLELGVKAGLIMCEGAEVMEALRSDDPLGPCSKIPSLNKVEEELADVVIRSLDLAERLGINLGDAIRIKYEYNLKRPYKHAKSF
jgi:NTP pyrophosphatase (non-canonical NTP hydrolase)